MKVICIDADAYPDDSIPFDVTDVLKNGEIYNVIEVALHDDGFIWYKVHEDLCGWYWENCFARTSNIDETEMERNYNELLTTK